MDYQKNDPKKPGNDPEVDPPSKKVEKVVKTDAVEKPRTLGRRFKDVFFGGEFSGAAKYITADVLLPALRNLVVDASTKGIERIIYGEAAPRRRPEYRPRTQYNSPISHRREDPRDRVYLPDQPAHNYRANRREANDIIIATRDEADLVLETLIEITQSYDVASLADLYELVGLPSSHTDNKWGWTHLGSASVRQVRDGYLLDLPTMEQI